MNIQALMKQAQSLQKDMLKTKNEIDNMTFTGSSQFVSVIVKGDKTVEQVKIDSDNLNKDDIEILQDLIVVACNDAFKQIDKVTEDKMGKYNSMMPGGLF